MITRFYVHNFRCLEKFELPIAERSSVLLIGKNGVGKTSVRRAFEILQKIARGVNRVHDFVTPDQRTWGREDVPMRFEIEALLGGRKYHYSIAFDFPKDFKELRILDEAFVVDGIPVFRRELAQVHLLTTAQDVEARFRLDWHLAALPIVQDKGEKDALFIFKQWLARMMILQPIPSLITGESNKETLSPRIDASDFGDWVSGLLAQFPAAYGTIADYLKEVMPDFNDFKNPPTGKNSKSLEVQFSHNGVSVHVPFAELSDGEKCFMIAAVVLAASKAYGPLVCFWDEPDNHLSLSEVGHFTMALRKAFQAGGQFIATSHNPEAIRKFSDENTLLLFRNSHLESTTVRPVSELTVNGDLVNALIRGDVEPPTLLDRIEATLQDIAQ